MNICLLNSQARWPVLIALSLYVTCILALPLANLVTYCTELFMKKYGNIMH